MTNPGVLKANTALGSYRIIEAVDINNHSVLYRARTGDANEEVLLQEFLPEDLVKRQRSDQTICALSGKEKIFEDSLSLFLQEARILSQIRDPYIVRVIEYTEGRGTAFMVMELEQGQTLDEHLNEVGQIEENELRQLFLSLLKGLRVIHANNLLHRDINPRSIFLRDNGPPLILGFGSTQRALAVGEIGIESRATPGFSPIEQYHEGGDLGPWTDLYAAGAVLYKSITGVTPVEAPERVAALAEGEQDPLTPAAETGRGKYHASLLSGVDWLLKPFIDKRPQSAGDILGPAVEPTPHRSPAPSARTKAPTPQASSPEQSKVAAPPQQEMHPDSPQLYVDPTTRINPEPDSNKRASNYLAGFIVAVLVVAVGIFTFWPQIESMTGSEKETAQTQSTIEDTTIPDNILEQPLPDEEQPPDPPESLTFTRKEDDIRADEYRKLAQYNLKLRTLLESARSKLLVGKLIAPDSNNALVDYRTILEIDEDNVDALQGIEDIAISVFNRAQTEFEQGDLEASLSTLLAMQEAGLETEEATALRAEIGKLYERKAAEEEHTRQLVEQQRIELEKKTEEERLRQAELAAEQERLEQEKLAEEEHARQAEIAAEQERLEQVWRAEEERARQTEQARLEQEALAAEERARQAELAAEKERLELKKKAEEERLRQAELAAEQERLEQARRAEEEHARQAEQDRLAQEQQAEQARQEQARRAEEERARQAELTDEQKQVEQVRSLQVQELLASAAAAQAAGFTDASAGDALTNYREVLSVDPGNETAQKGIAEIVDHYVELANRALALDQFDQTENHLLLISAIDPNHPAVDIIRSQIKIQREAFAQAQLKLQREKELAKAAQEKAQQELLKQKERELEQRTLSQGINAYYLGEYSTAMELLLPLAEKDNNRAQFRVGVMYLRGRGVEKNASTGTAWIRRAFPGVQSSATSGEAWAQADLGSLYQTGLLVAQNDKEAVRWYLLAAEQGYAGAQTNLGTMYANGSGVTKSRDEAIKWLKRAAAQGDKVAQNNLSVLGVQ